MLVRYKVLLLQDGNSLKGTAEKIYERANGSELFYYGANRVRVIIEGSARKGYLQRSQLLLHFAEDGEIRQSSTVVRLSCLGFARGMTLEGVFSTTSADSTGTITCKSLPLNNAILEYQGLPIKWFGRLIEIATFPLYRAEWRQLRQQIASSRPAFLKTYADYNCRPFVWRYYWLKTFVTTIMGVLTQSQCFGRYGEQW